MPFLLFGWWVSPARPRDADVQLPLHPALHVLMPLLVVQPVSASHVPASRPPTRSGGGAPVFTSDLRDQHVCCEHTGPLRHVTGFPGLGLLRVLRPIPPASAGNGPSRRPAQCRPAREPGGWFPRSLSNRLTGSASNYAPPTSPRLRRRHSPWPPGRRPQPTKESPHTTISCGGVRCCAAPIHQVRAAGCLEELSDAGIFTYAFLSH